MQPMEVGHDLWVERRALCSLAVSMVGSTLVTNDRRGDGRNRL